MMRISAGPAGVARTLANHLRKSKKPVHGDLLSEIIDVAYYASMQFEEQRGTVFCLTYCDPANPDPDKPSVIRAHRWTSHAFAARIPLTVRNLVKLAPSASPSSTLIAIHANDAGPFIWGLVDQQTDFRSALDLETSGHFSRPGCFQLEVMAPGSLQVFDDMHHVVTLRERSLVYRYPEVLSTGPIAAKLQPHIAASARQAIARASQALSINFDRRQLLGETLDLATEVWTHNLCRILLRIQRRHHGGAMLLSSADGSHLSVKYELNYHRLENIIVEHIAQAIVANYVGDHLRSSFVDAERPIPLELYLDEAIAQGNLDDAEIAERGAVGFIASLSMVDGLVLMQNGLRVRGYGVEITAKKDPNHVLVASEPTFKHVGSLKKDSATNYGTRHRSMMRYCAAHGQSVGFVVSQDGSVRCISMIHKKVLMWDNIKLQDLN